MQKSDNAQRPIIQFDRVTLAYSDQPPIIENATFQVLLGERIALIGPSGSGKSSLLRALIGAVPLVNGKIFVNNMKLTPKNSTSIRSVIAYIGQEPILGGEIAKDALLLPFTYRAHRNLLPTNEQLEKALQNVGLPPSILTKRSSVLSGGERQRVAIARAILLKKQIFVADEITSALDDENKKQIISFFSDRKKTLLSVTHDPKWIAFCDRTLTVQNGCLKNPLKALP